MIHEKDTWICSLVKQGILNTLTTKNKYVINRGATGWNDKKSKLGSTIYDIPPAPQ